jgi:tellurite resistance protein TehA-like permease
MLTVTLRDTRLALSCAGALAYVFVLPWASGFMEWTYIIGICVTIVYTILTIVSLMLAQTYRRFAPVIAAVLLIIGIVIEPSMRNDFNGIAIAGGLFAYPFALGVK